MLNYFSFILLLSLTIPAWALELKSNALILTHTSKYYQTGSETIQATQDLIQNAQGQVIALVQNPLSTDKDWYGLPLSKIQYEFYSISGDHKLSFPQSGNMEVTAVGGYMSACLGRTASTLVSRFILSSGSSQNLVINFPMKGIFTGFIEEQDKLTPSSPYKESILDSTMDGLNLNQATKLIAKENQAAFISEIIRISILEKSPMPKLSREMFFLEANLKGQKIYQVGNKQSRKKITLNFY